MIPYKFNLINILVWNQAINSGGSVYINHNLNSTLILYNEFVNCNALNDGGSIYIDSFNNQIQIISYNGLTLGWPKVDFGLTIFHR